MAGPSSIIGALAVRVARLTADGTPDFNNPTGGFILCGGISKFEHKFEIETGIDIFDKDAAGNACAIMKQRDLTKRVTFILTMCKSDYRLDEILGIAQAVNDGPNVAGRAYPIAAGCGAGTPFPGVSLEIWSNQWDCAQQKGAAAGALPSPYMRTILPRCYLYPVGYVRENAVSMPVYEGYSTPNANWGDGPFGDADVLAGYSGWALADIDQTALPFCPPTVGYMNIPPAAS
jgi:hypothetical protein